MPYPTQPGQVGGHEGVGIVHKLGPGSENGRIKVGDRVGIKVRIFRVGAVEMNAEKCIVDCVCLRSV